MMVKENEMKCWGPENPIRAPDLMNSIAYHPITIYWYQHSWDSSMVKELVNDGQEQCITKPYEPLLLTAVINHNKELVTNNYATLLTITINHYDVYLYIHFKVIIDHCKSQIDD